MNKLEEYRSGLTVECMPFDHEQNLANNMIIKGFDAAIALELPSKFHAWISDNLSADVSKMEKWKRFEGTTQEEWSRYLFEYWINNIYEP